MRLGSTGPYGRDRGRAGGAFRAAAAWLHAGRGQAQLFGAARWRARGTAIGPRATVGIGERRLDDAEKARHKHHRSNQPTNHQCHLRAHLLSDPWSLSSLIGDLESTVPCAVVHKLATFHTQRTRREN
jgi:hypothetical protein